MWLMEIKVKDGKLSKDQLDWHSAWNAKVHVVRSVEDALTVINGKV